MCDMTQFVVSIPIKYTEASYLARLFVAGIFLKFGLCLMVIVGDGNTFRGEFEQMYEMLNMRFHIVAKRNYKAVGIEQYHKFLIFSQRIESERRQTPEAFVEIGMVTACAWDASPIDGTDIIRSVPAIGRELRFPIDMNTAQKPQQSNNKALTMANYLRLLDRNVDFSRELLSWTIDDRRLIHRERVNEKRHLVEYKPGDIVMIKVVR